MAEFARGTDEVSGVFWGISMGNDSLFSGEKGCRDPALRDFWWFRTQGWLQGLNPQACPCQPQDPLSL